MTLGQRLYELRKSKGLSQESAAEKLGVTRQTVSKWETDQTTPDLDKIVPLCELYGITADELLNGKGEDDARSADGSEVGGSDNNDNNDNDNNDNGADSNAEASAQPGFYNAQPQEDAAAGEQYAFPDGDGNYNYGDANGEKPKKQGKKLWTIIIVLLVIIALLLIGITAFSVSSHNKGDGSSASVSYDSSTVPSSAVTENSTKAATSAQTQNSNNNQGKTVVYDNSFPLGDVATLSISADRSDIDIMRGNENAVRVTAVGKSAEHFSAELDGKTLYVTANKNGGGSSGGGTAGKNADIIIYLPDGCGVPISITSDTGDVDIECTFSGELTVKSNTGDVDAKHLTGSFNITVGTGDVEIDRADITSSSSVTVKTGDISIDRADNVNIIAKATLGKCDIPYNNPSSPITLTAQTDAGDIEINDYDD